MKHERSPYSQVRGPSESFVDVRHAHLEDMRDDARTRRHVIAVDIGDDDGTVRSNTQLSAVRVSDPHPLRESEGGLQPFNRGSHVGVDQHRRDGGAATDSPESGCGGHSRALVAADDVERSGDAPAL